LGLCNAAIERWQHNRRGQTRNGCSPIWRATVIGVYFLGLVAPLAGAVAGLPAFGADFVAGLAWSFILRCS
jgi:hypothetical protein